MPRVDNFHTVTKDNIAHLFDCANFELMRHDVTFPRYVEVDEIYNLACPASPLHYQHDPVQTTETRVHGAINLLRLAKRVKADILGVDEGSVRRCTRSPAAENYWGHVNSIGPRFCNDEGKRSAETLFMDYRRQHGLSVRIARIFNMYGPRMHPADGRLVSNFMVQALRGEPITLSGNGSQTRSFCYVNDMIEAFIRLMNTEDDLEAPVNLGNPHEVSMREIAQRILTITASDSPLELRPVPADDPSHRQPDSTRVRELLGWQPRTSLDDGLATTPRYFRARIEAGAVRSPDMSISAAP